jgi:hypothetical protein
VAQPKLLVDGKTLSVTSNLTSTTNATPAVTALTGRATYVRAGLSSLVLDFALDMANNLMTGTLTDSVTGAVTPLNGYRNVWHATNNPASSYKDGYTFGLEIDAEDDGDLEVPQGNGFGSFTVGLDGSLSCVGSTADGLAYTSGGFVGPTGDVIIYAPFSASVGSLSGRAHITPDVGSSFVNNTFIGALTWSKNAAPATSTNYAYRAGFTPRNLSLVGGKYKAPANGAVIMGINNTVNDNTKLSFAAGGLVTGQLNPQIFSIRNTGAAVKQTITLPTINTNKLSFALAVKPLGQFSGGITIPHPVTTLTRTAKYSGMIVWTGSASARRASSCSASCRSQGMHWRTPRCSADR